MINYNRATECLMKTAFMNMPRICITCEIIFQRLKKVGREAGGGL